MDDRSIDNPKDDAKAATALRQALERFGDAHKASRWQTGQTNYVKWLALTPANVPELLDIARQWAEPFDWPEDKKDVTGYAPIHAWRCLAQLQAVEAIPVLLGMIEPLHELEDDWYLEEFPRVFAWIGAASLAPLRDYLNDAQHTLYPRVSAASGLRELALRHPHLRDEVIKTLSDALSRFEENDQTLNGFIVADLLDVKAVEAAEVMERAHAADRVDISISGCWETVRKELGVEGLGLVPAELANARYNFFNFSRVLAGDNEDDLADDDDRDDSELDDDEFLDDAPMLLPDIKPAEVTAPIRTSNKIGRNDPCPCGSGKKYKKCCGR